MELKNGYILLPGIIICLVLLAVTCFFRTRRDNTYSGGLRVANTERTRKLPIYQRLMWFHRILVLTVGFALAGAIVACLLLTARPIKEDSVKNGVKKRDIFLCLDVSYSLYEQNYDIVTYLKQLVSGLKGDRFGITIFNTSTVVYVPLTDDYDFIEDRLNELGEYFKLQKEYEETFEKYDGDIPKDMDDEYNRVLFSLREIEAGTLTNNHTKGSSLIGEGLASAMYSFTDLTATDRTRVIILSTDNAENAFAPPLVSLSKAAELCRQYRITVFGIYPDRENYYKDEIDNYDRNCTGFKDAVRTTDGKCYVRTDTNAQNIVKDIQKQPAMTVSEIVSTRITDQPEKPLYLLLGCLMLAAIAGWELKK